jgi:Na+-transporting methylmalonyl-CoA/oxaloacetate decarboxylase gamma subunit
MGNMIIRRLGSAGSIALAALAAIAAVAQILALGLTVTIILLGLTIVFLLVYLLASLYRTVVHAGISEVWPSQSDERFKQATAQELRRARWVKTMSSAGQAYHDETYDKLFRSDRISIQVLLPDPGQPAGSMDWLDHRHREIDPSEGRSLRTDVERAISLLHDAGHRDERLEVRTHRLPILYALLVTDRCAFAVLYQVARSGWDAPCLRIERETILYESFLRTFDTYWSASSPWQPR